eukprot:gene2868-1853_t
MYSTNPIYTSNKSSNKYTTYLVCNKHTIGNYHCQHNLALTTNASATLSHRLYTQPVFEHKTKPHIMQPQPKSTKIAYTQHTIITSNPQCSSNTKTKETATNTLCKHRNVPKLLPKMNETPILRPCQQSTSNTKAISIYRYQSNQHSDITLNHSQTTSVINILQIHNTKHPSLAKLGATTYSRNCTTQPSIVKVYKVKPIHLQHATKTLKQISKTNTHPQEDNIHRTITTTILQIIQKQHCTRLPSCTTTKHATKTLKATTHQLNNPNQNNNSLTYLSNKS